MTERDTEKNLPKTDGSSSPESLQALNQELADSLHRMTEFQDQLRTLRACQDLDSTLDSMELLLDDILDVVYLRIYFAGPTLEDMRLVREMCPQEKPVDWSLVQWALSNNEPAFIPVSEDPDAQDELVQNLLILPLVGHSERVGAVLIWADMAMSAFTQERSTLLSMLARETASVLESLLLRKRLEDAHSEILDIVENIPMGVMAIDGDSNLRLINGTAEYIFNAPRNEAVGHPLQSILPPEVFNKLKPALSDQGLAASDESELEINVSGIEDEAFGVSVAHLRSASSSLDEDSDLDQAPGHVIVCRDLKLSREVAKLRELDAMKNDFLSLVSHELRTPLTSIMAYSETLLMEGMIETDEERNEYLEIIHSEGERLSRLINDVLDLTKMESGKMDYIYGSVQMADTIKSAMATVHSLATQKSMNMETNIDESLPEIKADRDKIIQVLTNFYSNAIKFTDEGGTITTHCHLVQNKENEDLQSIQVGVQDTGMGIPQSEIHKVFSKFEQVEKIDHHSVGTGLGMPICKLIIEEGHAGSIWIESEVGIGTTVFFEIPTS